MSGQDLSVVKAFSTVISRGKPPEVFELLQAILTNKELEHIETRLRVAALLQSGLSYTQIQKELKVSAATVATVSEQLKQPVFLELISKVGKELARFRFFRT